MVKHIVMWRLKDEQKEENIRKLKKALQELPAKIPVIKDLDVGLNFNHDVTAFDVVLVTSFATVEDLEAYQNHPDHRKVVMFIQEIKKDRVVVDYMY